MIDLAARLVLSPVLIAQGLNARRMARKLPEAAGPRSGTIGSGPDLHLRIIGDSSAAGVGVAQQSQALSAQMAGLLARDFTVHWHLDALTGATTRSTLTRLANAPRAPTDVIVTALGVNDITRQIPLRLWKWQQNCLLARLQVLYDPRHIYMSGMPPMGAFPLLPHPLRWTLGRQAQAFDHAQARRAALCPSVTHVPFNLSLQGDLMAEDGFHPNATLYSHWAKEIASRIVSDWSIKDQG